MGTKVRIEFRYDHRSSLVVQLVSALLLASTSVYLVWNLRPVAASGPQASLSPSSAMRRYYKTTSFYYGANADGSEGNGAGVCAPGYHFASMWEITDTSNLEYNTDLGFTWADSGQGPPSYSIGWVRTGYYGGITSTPGQANCDTWDSSSNINYGSVASLPKDWAAGEELDIWMVSAASCDLIINVWCVEDDIGENIFLPLVLKN